MGQLGTQFETRKAGPIKAVSCKSQEVSKGWESYHSPGYFLWARPRLRRPSTCSQGIPKSPRIYSRQRRQPQGLRAPGPDSEAGLAKAGTGPTLNAKMDSAVQEEEADAEAMLLLQIRGGRKDSQAM